MRNGLPGLLQLLQLAIPVAGFKVGAFQGLAVRAEGLDKRKQLELKGWIGSGSAAMHARTRAGWISLGSWVEGFNR
jgi:hypothetical protein